jgi:hypothetical protein
VVPPTDPTRRRSRVIGLAIAIVALGLGWLAVDTAQGLLAMRAEQRGVVTVSRCAFLNFNRAANTYTCVGSFAADRGDLRVPDVVFTHTGDVEPGEKLVATVSGPDDDTASIPEEFGLVWRLVAMAAGIAAIVALVRHLRRLGHRPRAGAGA